MNNCSAMLCNRVSFFFLCVRLSFCLVISLIVIFVVVRLAICSSVSLFVKYFALMDSLSLLYEQTCIVKSPEAI